MAQSTALTRATSTGFVATPGVSDHSGWTLALESWRSRGKLLHGWGTLTGHGEPPCAIWAEYVNGSRIPALPGKIERHPAGNRTRIDFVLYGAFPDGADPDSLQLVLEWPEGPLRQLPLPPPRAAPASRGFARIMDLPWAHYFSRGWRLIRQRQTGLLLNKLAGMSAALLTSGWHPARLLNWAAAAGRPLALVIDHDLGGGANLYRQSHMAQIVADGFMPLLLSAHHGILSYQLTAIRGKRCRTAHIDNLDALFAYLALANIRRVAFNNILSFPAPLAFVATLTKWLQQQAPEQFLFLLHDHYCICPVWLLLNDKGVYCGIPDTSICTHCLRHNTAPFLEFAAGVDIATWRAAWGALLDCAHEVRCFSETTRLLVLRAHPHLPSDRITVVPHRVKHVALRSVVLKDPGWPVIGIVGHISYHKGGKLVQELAEHIRDSGNAARIVVIGTIDYPLPPSVATITGTYRPEQLPDWLEHHGVNIGFFSSICPETFSYVTEELMTMGLPLVALDIGAPGERISRYGRGHVLPLSPPDQLLEHITRHYHMQVRPQAATHGRPTL